MNKVNKLLPAIKDISLLDEALTHRSFSNENPGSKDYERLEFLGDAVISLFVAAELIKKYPEASEGELTVFRANLVNQKSLAEIAKKLNLDKLIKVGKGSQIQNDNESTAVLCDVLESITGAYYLESSYIVTADWLKTVIPV